MIRTTLAIALLLVCGMIFAQAAPDLTSPMPVDPELITGTLPNGLKYYIKVNHKPEKRAELRLVVNVGSVQEDDDQQGLAHVNEHMAFDGTQHFKKSELVDYLNSIGMGYAAGLNAGTSLDQITYQLQIPTDNAEQFGKGFLILSDWANKVTFDNKEIEKERLVIIEEWRRGQGADERMSDAQRKVIFAGSKYAERAPIGKLDVLQNFKPDTLRRFYSDWYRPDLQAVVAVGDFDAKQVEALIKEYFTPIPAKANPRPVILYDVPDNADPKVVITTDKEASETSVQLTWKHDRMPNQTVGDYRKTLINNLYTQMLNMRLQELAQQADPPFSGAGNYNYNAVRSKSNYTLMANVPEDGIVRGMTTLLTEAERVKQFGFTQSEFDRTKQMMLRSAERQLAEKDTQDSKRLVYRYIGNFTTGNPIMSIEQNVALNRELYNTITLADVEQACRNLITDNNLVIAVAAPEKEGLVLPTEQTLLDLITQVKNTKLTAYQDVVSNEDLLQAKLTPGKITAQKAYPKIGVKEWTLSNGIRVLLKPTTFKNDEVMLKAFSPGGNSLYDVKDLYEAREAADIIISSGVNGFDATTLEKKLAGKIVNVDPYIYSNEEGFTGNCSKADMETMFQLVYLYATAPRLDDQSYASWLARTTTSMQNQALDPESAYSDSVYAVTYDHHPRAKNMTVDDLKTLDMNRILQIYKDRFADFTDFTFIVVGAFDEKQLKDYCLKYLANLPAHGVKEQVKDNGVRYAKGKREIDIYKGQAEKSTVQFIIAGDCKIDSKTSNNLRNLTDLMDEKLRENIREARSGVYYIGAYDNIKKYPNPTYQITVYMQCAPDRVEELSAAVIGTLDSLKAGLIANKYVNMVKITRQKQLETSMMENQWWMNSLYNRVWNKYPLDDVLNDKKAIDNINLKELQSSAKLFLNQDNNLIRGIWYPIAKAKDLQEPK